MHILLYVPDNQVTHNFMPQLWPFILQRRTPPGHKVTIIDGNVARLTPQEVAEFVVKNGVDLVGIGFMTRMAQKAYQVAQAVREATGIPVVMGGPHVSAEPDEPLGGGGRPQSADSVVVGEADTLWPQIVDDASRGSLRRLYKMGGDGGGDGKPCLEEYPITLWDQVDLSGFDVMRLIPATVKNHIARLKIPFERIYIFPVESGRGCPYGCEFCSVTGFFGDKIRFRTTESVIAELRLIRDVAKRDRALAVIFFVDDNFAIHRERAKTLLRALAEEKLDLNWCAQISVNLLKDEELVDLMAKAGGRWVFVGLESIEADSLKSVNKSFNRPEEYAAILDRMARKGVYAMTSFVYGFDADRPGCAGRVVEAVSSWPPVIPVFGLLTPLPGTPLYKRLLEEGRLTRPRHWLDFQANKAAFEPRLIDMPRLEEELKRSWLKSYRASEFARTQRWMLKNGRPFEQQAMLFVFRLILRGIYFPQKNVAAWMRLLACNVFTLCSLVHQGFKRLRPAKTDRLSPIRPLE